MKTKRIFIACMATLMLAAMPNMMISAEEMTDTVQKPASVPATKIVPSGMTVNGRPATKQEKAVAKQMVKQGVQMATKGAQMAASAVTNPAQMSQMQKEMEAMGNELERLGDSLETLAEDTTFLYEGEDEDSVFLSDDDFEDLTEQLDKIGWLSTWWGKVFGGSLGILGGIFAVLVAILVVVLLFLLFTSPLWVIALIVWLIIRSSRRPRTTAYVNPPLNSTTQQTTGDAAGTANGASTTVPPHAAAQPTGYVQPYPDENTEMWKSGVMTACIGVGLIILFFTIGLEDLWGIGALVGCIGVAKLVIASTTKKKSTPTQDNVGSYSNSPTPTTEDYNRSENA